MDQQEDSMIPTQGRCNLHWLGQLRAPQLIWKFSLMVPCPTLDCHCTQNPTVCWINLYLKWPLDRHEAFLSFKPQCLQFWVFWLELDVTHILILMSSAELIDIRGLIWMESWWSKSKPSTGIFTIKLGSMTSSIGSHISLFNVQVHVYSNCKTMALNLKTEQRPCSGQVWNDPVLWVHLRS